MHKDDVTVGATYIHDFTMLPIDEFNEYCAKTSDTYLTAEHGGVISYELESSIAGYSKSEGTVGEVDGRFGANIFAGSEVTFSAPGTTLAGEKGAVVVECYAAEKTKITVTENGNIRRVEHPGGSWQTLSFLREEMVTGEYTLVADKNITIASIHYAPTERTVPPYDTEEEEIPEEEIPDFLDGESGVVSVKNVRALLEALMMCIKLNNFESVLSRVRAVALVLMGILSFALVLLSGINTMTAEEPMTAVAIGTGKYVEFLSGYRDE